MDKQEEIDPILKIYAQVAATESELDAPHVYANLVKRRDSLAKRLNIGTADTIGKWALIGLMLALDQKEFKSNSDIKRARLMERIFQHGGHSSDEELIDAIQTHGTGQKDIDQLFGNTTSVGALKNSISRGRRELGIEKKHIPED